MRIRPIKTRIAVPPRDDLFAILRQALPAIPENSVIAVTSKIVSIGEGRCVSQAKIKNKDALIQAEADYYLPRSRTPGRLALHTIKNNLYIPSAGIDESNGDGYYILWPKNPHRSARAIHRWLKRTYRLKNVGVIITDSHSLPLRRGVVGISLAHHGFFPLKDYRGSRDLFLRELKMTQSNLVDALATAAVLVMGEGDEKTPLTLITHLPFVEFGTQHRSSKPYSTFEIPRREDIYRPFFSNVGWIKGGRQGKKT